MDPNDLGAFLVDEAQRTLKKVQAAKGREQVRLSEVVNFMLGGADPKGGGTGLQAKAARRTPTPRHGPGPSGSQYAAGDKELPSPSRLVLLEDEAEHGSPLSEVAATGDPSNEN